MNSLKIDWDVNRKCVADSFVSDGQTESTNYQLADNMVFQQHYNDYKTYGHNLFPSMVINQKVFRGRLTPDNSFEDICASFKYEPKQCRAWQIEEGIKLPQGQSTSISKKTLYLVVCMLVLTNIVIILLYRKFLQTEMDKDMKINVSSAVSQYVALSKIPELQSSRASQDELEMKETE